MPQYDHAFFKTLTTTDIGKKRGEQRGSNEGGPVIPSGLAKYFPPLSAGQVVADWPLTVDLVMNGDGVKTVVTRWQYQTRTGTRSPEYRITQNLKADFLEHAAPDDLIIFERYADSADRFRFELISRSAPEHATILNNAILLPRKHNQGPFGLIGAEPRSQKVVTREIRRLELALKKPFREMLKRDRRVATRRWARDAAFSRVVRSTYNFQCTACGIALRTPAPRGQEEKDTVSEWETVGAHIRPVALQGPDDVRNGISLCQTHHWAFDRFLIFVDDNLDWSVAPGALRGAATTNNNVLRQLDGRPFPIPSQADRAPDKLVLDWHRQKALQI